MNNFLNSEIDRVSNVSFMCSEVIIHQFSHLNEDEQEIALEVISSLNEKVSSTPGVTWEHYTPMIKKRIESSPGSKTTLFIAQVVDKFVGYAAFYRPGDDINEGLTWTSILRPSEAYCAWLVVSEDYRGQGIAKKLALKIFDEETGITSFKSHVRKDNGACIAMAESLTDIRYKVSRRQSQIHDMYVYNVNRAQTAISVAPEVVIHRFSDLDEQSQKIAFKAIALINKKASTTRGVTWEHYTPIIKKRMEQSPNSKSTFFVAQVVNEFVGYAAFYRSEDNINEGLTQTSTLNPNQAYCALVAVNSDYRGKGIAKKLELKIFDGETGITSFTCDIKKDNKASIRVAESFREIGYQVSRMQCSKSRNMYQYSVEKTPTDEVIATTEERES
jgi:ribosomal protein S18 acetylase RimI-like enzyme